MSLEYEAERGRLAQEVIDNPVYADAFRQIEQGLTQAWRESRDAAQREECHRLLKVLDKVQTALASTMRSGKVAEAELVSRATLAQRIGHRLTQR